MEEKNKIEKQKRQRCTCPNCAAGLQLENRKLQHLCDIEGCGKSFPKSSHLKEHLKRHQHEKPFVCTKPACGKRFTKGSDHKRHQQSHSGQKPFKCPECVRTFNRIDSAKRHRARVHKRPTVRKKLRRNNDLPKGVETGADFN